jgi:N-formylglutamate deformylase
MTPFQILPPISSPVPILVSVPHCGTLFPDEIKNEYNQDIIQAPDDTDWFVHQLYDFAPAMGITMIHAVYSRWVIDLNRDPQSKPLYSDGRIITGLCPTTNFLGEPLYKDARKEVDPAEVKRRLENYYQPYHQKVEELLQAMKKKFGKVLLWDCHSIRQVVKTIQLGKFPDLVLGDVDGSSAFFALTDATLEVLRSSAYTVQHNHPFKGGYLTRRFGNPTEGINALQLEMTKVNYMDDEERHYYQQRAGKMRILLKKIFDVLIYRMTRL